MVSKPDTRSEVSKVVIYHGGKLTEFAKKKKLSYVVLYNLLTGRTKYTEKHDKEYGKVLCETTGLTKEELKEAMSK